MGKIGDLWVRLGLADSAFKRGIDNAEKKLKGFSNNFTKMSSLAKTAWGAIGGAALAFMANQIVNATNRVGDAWQHTTAQMKAGWDVFLQSLSNWDWDNFIDRIKESTAAAKELQGVLDFEFESTNSTRLQKALHSEELAQLQIEMRDATKSYEERAAAAEKYLSIVKPIYEQEIKLRKQLMDANSSKWLSNSGFDNNQKNRDLLQRFLVDYGKDAGLIKSAGILNEAYKIRGNRFITTSAYLDRRLEEGSSYRAEVNRAQALLRNYAKRAGAEYDDILRLILIYEKSRGDKDTQPLVDSIVKYYNAEAAYDNETRRIQNVKNAAVAGSGSSSGTEPPPPKGSLAYLQQELKKAQDAAATAVGEEAQKQAMETVRKIEAEIEEMKKRMTPRDQWVGISAVKGIPMPGSVVSDDRGARGSIAWYSNEIKTLQSQMEETTDAAVRLKAQKTINEYEKEIERLKASVQLSPTDVYARAEAEGLKIPDGLGNLDADLEVPNLSTGMQDFTASTQESIGAVAVLAGSLSNLTGLVDSGAASWLSYGANVLQTVAQAIPAIASLTASKNAEATANAEALATGAGSAVAGIPFVGPVMAVAAIASVIAALANVPKFAEGGVVGGSSYYGDRILARLNSGELVLNQGQQAALLDNLERPGQNVHVSGDFRISGRDLRMVLDKYDNYRTQ